MKRVFLDIETLPPGESIREEIIFEIKNQIESEGLKPESEQVAAIADKEFRDLALCGDYGRILAIGLLIEYDGKIEHRGSLGRDRETRRFHLDEARTLKAFWNLMKDFDPKRDLIIGHNLLEFDLPFIYKRSIINAVRPSVNLCFARYRSQPIFDTMREWEKWGRKMISLDKLAKILGLESSKKNGLNGSKIYDYYCASKHEEIAEYCLRDVEVTREIFYRMKFIERKEKELKAVA